MYQRDFILRMIEELALLVAGILKLIRNGKPEEARVSLDRAYQSYLKQDAALFLEMPSDELVEKLKTESGFDDGHFEMLASLMVAEGMLRESLSESDLSMRAYSHALTLYRYLEISLKTYSWERQQQIDLLVGKLN